ncbi:unnamed protein product [Adineta ricciae]|uniref:AIG1-type G domain-containing protein n=1 Tax=Adineta ricciae TaxID=249248 RepID=A0A815WHC0_ADIRI|nr:unnamed protein product [Adineta ricciae]CAF1642782.1 unnamed protein product [Adineta ricciae]
MLQTIQDKLDEQARQFTGVPSNQPIRTLLLLGPSRAGKSTISQILRNSRYEPSEPKLYSATREPEHHSVGSLQIIDMPGFCDTQPQSSDFKLSNKKILSMLEPELDEADLVAFVFSLANGIDEAAVESMRLFQSKFPRFTKKVMLVITHAEEMGEDQKHQLVEDFFGHQKVIKYRLREFFQQGVHFLGSIRYESIQPTNSTAIFREHGNVLQMRQQFIDKCFQARIFNRRYPTRSTYSIKTLVFMFILFGIIAVISTIYLTKIWKGSISIKKTPACSSNTKSTETIPNEWFDEMQTKFQQTLEENLKIADERFKNAEDRLKNAEERFKTAEERFKNAEERFKDAEERFKSSEDRLQNAEERFKNSEERFNSTQQIINQWLSNNTCSRNIPKVTDKDEGKEENSIEEPSNTKQEDSVGNKSEEGWLDRIIKFLEY